MRRRPASGGAQHVGRRDDGIFVLAAPGAAAGRRRRQCAGVLATAAALFAVGRRTTTTAPAGVAPVEDGAASPERAATAPQTSTESPRARARTGGGAAAAPPRIPRRLIFTYEWNLIAPGEEAPPLDPRDPLTANVLQTITKYQRYWDEQDAQLRAGSVRGGEPLVVSFLSDEDCRGVITQAEPRLLQSFDEEERGEYKADICRVAELYLHGGYYFDIDIKVIKPVDFDRLDALPTDNPNPLGQLRALDAGGLAVASPDDLVTFATVLNKQGRFFQAFAAALPRHPVLERALEYMVHYYEGTLPRVLPQFILEASERDHRPIPSRDNMFGMGVGPYTLMVAYQATEDTEWEIYVEGVMAQRGDARDAAQALADLPARRRYSRFLYEIDLQDEELARTGLGRYFADVPRQDATYERKVHWCNYVCFGGEAEAYFYSRVPGSKGCPLEGT